jgi:regulator of protease activity HflC (stomatin/prohibitin superfamily)
MWLFLLRIVLGLIPGILVMPILVSLMDDFVRAVYGLKDRGEGGSALRRLLFGMSSFRPYLIIQDGKRPDDKEPLMRMGGPGSLVVYKDSAIVLEKAGKLTRVVKPGFGKLEDFERVWDVIDLRPHRWVYDVSAMSKDGISVTCQADVTFQIDDGGQAPSEKEPFPATEQAIFYAATRKWMREPTREDDQMFDWARRAIIGMTEGALRSILAGYLLDQILGPAESDLDIGHHRKRIKEVLEENLRTQFSNVGAKVISVELGDIKVEDKIVQQQIEAWQAFWQKWARERKAEGEAARLQAVEAAKAQAQADMIVAITQAFQSLTETGAIIPSQLVLLRMFEVLRRSSYDPQTGMLFLPAEVLKTWQLVQEITLGKRALPGAKEKSE